MGMANRIKRALYRRMPFERYLRTVSSGFFAVYRLGGSRLFATYEYPRFLKHCVRPGDTVIDIGANMGYYSWFFARLGGSGGRVYAVEPVVPIAGVLRRNVGKYGNVEIINCALGAEEKSIRMGNDSAPGSHFATGQNFVLDADGSGAAIEFASEMRRGSKLFGGLDRVDMIKCDIEGYEGVVLPEMEAVIDRHMPLVLVETGGDNRRMLTTFFEAKGYRGWVLEKGKLRPAAADDRKDIFFIPPARAGEFTKHTAR